MKRLVRWNDPLCTDVGCVVSAVATTPADHIIQLQKHNHPERNYSDEEALADWMIVNGAWLVQDKPTARKAAFLEAAQWHKERGEECRATAKRSEGIYAVPWNAQGNAHFGAAAHFQTLAAQELPDE